MKTFAQKIKTGFDRIEARYVLNHRLFIFSVLRQTGGKPTYSITVEVEKKKKNSTRGILNPKINVHL